MSFQKGNAWSVLVAVMAFAFTARAQDVSGTWAIQDLRVANKVQLSLTVAGTGKGSFNSTSTMDVGQLRGLNPAQLASPAATMARFELVREAGTFAAEGYFRGGGGSGTFVFRPDPGFLPQMRSLGFFDISEDRLFSLAVHDVGPRFASDIRATGVVVSRTDQLVAMRIHGVTTDFIRSMQQAGLRPEQDDLVKMRIHGVTPDFAGTVRGMYASAGVDDLVKMRIHGVQVDFARDVRQMYSTASLDELVRLKIHGVTLDFIRSMQGRVRNISLDEVVRLKIHGID